MARANVPRFFLVQFLGLWSLQLLEPSGPHTPSPPSAVRPWPNATPLLPEDHAVGLFWSSNQPVFGASRGSGSTLTMARANVPRFFLVQFLGLWSLQLLEPSGPPYPVPTICC
ncbi:hypothetical protein MRX96_032406 [Rhipicephalus microplus]